MTTKTSVDVRLSPQEKIVWQMRAERAGLSLSEYVRQLVQDDSSPSAPVEIDLGSEELQSLRAWLDLADSDGEIDEDLLAAWKAFAAESGITFAELLTRVVVDVNAARLTPRR